MTLGVLKRAFSRRGEGARRGYQVRLRYEAYGRSACVPHVSRERDLFREGRGGPEISNVGLAKS